MEKDQRITNELLIGALAAEHKVDKSKISVTEWSTSAGSGVTDNFACDMLAIKGKAVVDGKDKTFDYMAKAEPIPDFKKEMLKVMNICLKEYMMYHDIVPLLNEAREAKGLEPLKLPRCYLASVDPDILIMENLKVQDFVMRKSIDEGLNDSEVMAYVEALAAFHASTYHIINTKFGGLDEFLEKQTDLALMKPFTDTIQQMFTDTMKDIATNMDILAREHMDADIAERFSKFAPGMIDIFLQGFCKRVGIFQTLIHGDSWMNNAMFKHDANGIVTDFSMFDYQCCRTSSPAIDLAYLLVTGTPESRRTPNIEKWLKHYHDKFSADLAKLGHDANEVFSYNTLLKDYETAYGYSFTWAVQHCNMLLVKDIGLEELAKFKTMTTAEEQKKAWEELKPRIKEIMVTNLTYRERVTGLLKEASGKKLF